MSVAQRKVYINLARVKQSPLVPAFLSMVLMGATSSITGALLPLIARDFNLSASQIGWLVSSPAVGYVFAATSAGSLGDRIGFRQVWLIGVVTGFLALGGVSLAPSFGWLWLALGATGLVAGFLDGSINPLVAALSESSGKILNHIHLFFGLGATITPLLVRLGLFYELPWRSFYFIVAGYCALVGVGILFTRFPKLAATARSGESLFGVLRQRLVFLSVLAMLFYGGTEVSIFAWTPLYLERVRSVTVATASLSVALFGGAITVGRLVCAQVVERVGYGKTIIGGALLGAVGVGLILLPFGQTFWLGIIAAGLALAGIFATVMADVTGRISGQSGTVAGLLCSSCGVGMIIIPWTVGQVAQWTNLTTGMVVIIVAALAVALIYPARSRT